MAISKGSNLEGFLSSSRQLGRKGGLGNSGAFDYEPDGDIT